MYMNKKWFSRVTFLIVMLCIAFVVLIVYLKFDPIKRLILWDDIHTWDEQTLQIGEAVEFTGTLQETQDLLDSSHYVNHDTYGTVYLKSRNYNLFDYTGNFLIKGELDWFLWDAMIVEIKTLIKIKDMVAVQTGSIVATWEQKEDTRYSFPTMGVWFDEEFSEKYSIVEQTATKVIFQHTWEDKKFSISSFVCKKWSTSNDCEELVSVFEQSAEKKIINPITLRLYKLWEVDSWFFTHANQWYYLNDADADEVTQIANHLFVNNEWYVKNKILTNLSEYCADNQVVLDTYDEYVFTQWENTAYVTVKYNNQDTGKVFCKLELVGKEVLTREFQYGEYEEEEISEEDKKEEDKKEEISEEDKKVIDKKEDDSEEDKEEDKKVVDKKEEKQWENADFDTSVDQFSIKPDKALTFNSARWHKIVFPSPSIAYQEVSIHEDFGQAGVHCFAVVQVVDYAHQEQLGENNDLEIYECTVKKSFDDTAKTILYKQLWERSFVIKIINPAWNEFAHNVDIEQR